MTDNTYVIGISGIKRSGKDTCAKLISEMVPRGLFFDMFHLGFADAVKEEAALKLQVTREWINERKNDCPEIRQLLQNIGQSAREVNPNKWIDIMAAKIKSISSLSSKDQRILIIITDVRYPNEAEFVRKNYKNIIVKVERAGLENTDLHPSELGVGSILPDRTIKNNGTYMPDLQRECKWVWQEFLIKTKLI